MIMENLSDVNEYLVGTNPEIEALAAECNKLGADFLKLDGMKISIGCFKVGYAVGSTTPTVRALLRLEFEYNRKYLTEIVITPDHIPHLRNESTNVMATLISMAIENLIWGAATGEGVRK